VTYRSVASPLHAARAGAGAAYCLALGAAGLVFQHPLVLGALAVALLAAAVACRVGGALAGVLRLAVPLALLVIVVNALVSRNGLTVLLRLGELGPLGQVDVTLEALVTGAVMALRVVVVVLAGALFAAVVDPDALLRLFRRVSFRSALTAVLATRLVSVLARDARRLDDARRCRAPGAVPGRVAVLRAVTTGALDRAVDVAATLEVRGYGAHGPWPGSAREPWSRHDLAIAAAAATVVALTVAARLAGVASFAADQRLVVPAGAGELALAAALVAVALAPLADRRGIAR
jgi:energy-coupling factor transport system permease protein